MFRASLPRKEEEVVLLIRMEQRYRLHPIHIPTTLTINSRMITRDTRKTVLCQNNFLGILRQIRHIQTRMLLIITRIHNTGDTTTTTIMHIPGKRELVPTQLLFRTHPLHIQTNLLMELPTLQHPHLLMQRTHHSNLLLLISQIITLPLLQLLQEVHSRC